MVVCPGFRRECPGCRWTEHPATANCDGTDDAASLCRGWGWPESRLVIVERRIAVLALTRDPHNCLAFAGILGARVAGGASAVHPTSDSPRTRGCLRDGRGGADAQSGCRNDIWRSGNADGL